MTCQVLPRHMTGTSEAQRLRLLVMAAEFAERVGARIKERRLELRMTRPDVVARMSGRVNENQLYRWENGKHTPQPDTLEELAKVLKCDVSYFMVPQPVPGTPDLMGELRAAKAAADAADIAVRLDRLEAKLDEVLRILQPLELTGGERDVAPTVPASPQAPRAARPQGRAGRKAR